MPSTELVTLRRITQNERFSIKNTLREMEKIYAEDIVEPLKRKYANMVDLRKYFYNLPMAIGKIAKVLEKHVDALVSLELLKNEKFTTLNIFEQQDLKRRLLNDSWYQQSLQNLINRLQQKIILFVNSGNFDHLEARELFRTELYNIGLTEFHTMRRLLLTESQMILNNTQEAVYRKEEEELGVKYYYRWSTAHDKRLTEYCREIRTRVESRGGGVLLDELKRIVQQVSTEMMPQSFRYRDWQPHYNCRSSLTRIVLRPEDEVKVDFRNLGLI